MQAVMGTDIPVTIAAPSPSPVGAYVLRHSAFPFRLPFFFLVGGDLSTSFLAPEINARQINIDKTGLDKVTRSGSPPLLAPVTPPYPLLLLLLLLLSTASAK